MPRWMQGITLLAVVTLLSACGGTASPAAGTGTGQTGTAAATTAAPADTTVATTAAAPPSAALTDWPEFGLDPQRSDATDRTTGVTAANVKGLRDRRVSLPGTVDSSPIYLHGASVGGSTHDVVVVTTTYGRTLAIDAADGAILWTFTPPGYAGWAGTAQITNTSPVADPDRRFVYAASPNGLIHKLSLDTGAEASGAWPARVTRDPHREKLASALNLTGSSVVATTGGYIGDAPTYQGHVALISRTSGRVVQVFNSLCADRHTLITPTSCGSSDSAVLSRGGAVVEPGGRRLLFSTGNAPWNGTTDFGDSVIELTVPGLKLRQAYAPTDQARLNSTDLDLGSSAPALLSSQRVLVAGKDAVMRVLDLQALDGHAPSHRRTLGGEVQTFPTPGHQQLFTQPAVWRHGGTTTVFVADASNTAAYTLRGGKLHARWSNGTPGTSPIVAGGLLYVYEPSGGGIEVYRPGSSHPIAKLAGTAGHWNSPIVVDGHVVEPEGNANDHALTGTLDLFSVK
jgi:hypothetical protein